MRTFCKGSVLAGILILVTVSAFTLDVGNERAQAAFAEGNKETLVGRLEIDGSVISITTSSGSLTGSNRVPKLCAEPKKSAPFSL